MLEDQVAYLLQRYLGNYVRGLNKEALKISVWQGDVELTNMQLKPEALNALKLPVKVKAGFLGSVKLKVPWSKLGQDPVLVYLDRIFLLAEPATQVEGSTEDAVQEAKKNRLREMETKLLESQQILNSEMNKSWLGSLINTVIGNLKLSISNVHIRYEDIESNPGHPFAAGVTLDRLSAFTVDDNGKETFVTGGALERLQKSVELDRMAVYLDSDISPWYVEKPWEDLLPFEWGQVFKFGTRDGKPEAGTMEKHSYVLQPVSGNANYSKDRQHGSMSKSQPLQKATVNLDDVTLCLSKNGYRDILKLADNFAAFSQRLRYAHYRPRVSLVTDPRSWWKYAYRAVSDQLKKSSGKLSWEHVLRYAKLRKKYISLYAALLKSDLERAVVYDNEEIEELDRELDAEVILQWRMLAHKFVEQSTGSKLNIKSQKAKNSWWSFGWASEPVQGENEPGGLTEKDWERLNDIIGYKEGGDKKLLSHDQGDLPYLSLNLHMKHNASKLIDVQECLADLSCDNFDCRVTLYPETKTFDIKLGSYRLLSPNGLLAESESTSDSLVGVFCYKPLKADVDWSLVAKASPCYVTYLKDSVNQIIDFFQSNTAVSQTLARETASAVQTTIDEVKRTAARQVNKALKERTRFLLDLDIAAPKITIPTDFSPDSFHPTKLLLDLGKLVIRSQDDVDCASPEEMSLYSQFDLILRDVSAFLVDGDYHWSQAAPSRTESLSKRSFVSFLPVIDKCGVFLKLQQIRSPLASFPSTRLALQLPSLGFHFSPSRYHRLMQVAKIFEGDDTDNPDLARPWDQADFGGWLYHLTWKGVAGREAVWQRRYLSIVGSLLYVLENPESRNYKHSFSLRGKQLYQVPADAVGNVEHVLAVRDAERPNIKVVEDANALILRCDSEVSRRTWQSSLQGAIYRASGTASITDLIEASSDSEASEIENPESTDLSKTENFFLTGILDELKISFSYSSQESMQDQSFMKLLLADEKPLIEFRAIGGQVELSMKANDIFIGTVLKSLEIEDLVCCKGTSQICYLTRSFIRNAELPSILNNTETPSQSKNDTSQYEGDDEFYEASESLNDSISSPLSRGDSRPIAKSDSSDLKIPSFIRVAGLLPFDGSHMEAGQIGVSDAIDSFVKAQIVIFDQNSQLYANVDKQVAVTLSTLSFFCRRPTILAIMDFVTAINTKDNNFESISDDASPTAVEPFDISHEIGHDGMSSTPIEEPVAKSLLGKGKSRVIFHLALNMARAEILLMMENGSKLATLAQNNFLTDIKVFPSSFSINASLGNLRISDDSLHSSHMYFWACDMRNPGGNSFVELSFCSFSADDEDYEGYDYSLIGQLSEVRVVYLNRFLQEIIRYFMGLVPSNSTDDIKIMDQVTDSDKWLSRSEIEGSPAIKLDLSLKKPIILMPRRTNSMDYLKLDVVQITVQNTFRWFGGKKSEMKAVHLDILTILVEDINLNVGSGSELSESIIQDVKGVSIIIQRALRDLWHQIPSTEVAITIEELKAALSNREYEIITECAQANISEAPNIVPPLRDESLSTSVDVLGHTGAIDSTKSEIQSREKWVTTKVSVRIDLVELCLHYGFTRDASLATLQVSGVWLLYKSDTVGDGFLSATLKDLTVVDDREGIEKELRLAIGKPDMTGYNPSQSKTDNVDDKAVGTNISKDSTRKFIPAMLIFDARFCEDSTYLFLCIQRPQLLVALDFLLAIVEFFVPTVRGEVLLEENANSFVDALILDQQTFYQPTAEFSISPQKPLVADDERFDIFIYDGKGGSLYLKDKNGSNLSCPSAEALVYVGNGKKLQFRNVTVKSGTYLDTCILLGSNSSYSANEHDNVYLEGVNDSHSDQSSGKKDTAASQNTATGKSTELIFELQAIGPELTFYNTSQNAGSLVLSNKLLHAQLDAFCRLILKGNTIEMNANALGFTMESNGIKILEPFDTVVTFSNASGMTNLHLEVSDVFMNFSFSILRLFLAVEEDILSFLRTRSKESTVLCSEFDRIGTIKNPATEQIYAFWRPRAPTGFAVLGDYLTPIDKPPTKGVIAVNTNLIRVKRPKSFTLVWPSSLSDDILTAEGIDSTWLAVNKGNSKENAICSVWFPEAPKGYVALGCVVSAGRAQPPISSVFCISTTLVSPCGLRDCISVGLGSRFPDLAFWRVDNAVGTFLPADPATMSLTQRAYELRHLLFGFLEISPQKLSQENQTSASVGSDIIQSERSSAINSLRRFEAVPTFRLIWWNQGSGSRKKLSIWRPIVPEGMVYFGDIAVQGYEPPNNSIVLQDSEDCEIYKPPSDFQLVGHINKKGKLDSISFWMPQASPGFVSLGCVACKGMPKQSDINSLRCIRSDMISADQFLEESTWDTSDYRFTKDQFSIWTVNNDLGTFIIRNGLKKPPKRFAFKLVDPDITSGSDITAIAANLRTFSVALFDDYGGLMVPLCNISLSGAEFNMYGRPDSLNSTVSFSLAARSYNDKYESWEPLIEPVDGSLRYEYNPNGPGMASQLRLTTTRDLNLNVSVSNANMVLQAYASWSNQSHVPESSAEAHSPFGDGRSLVAVHQRTNCYIAPQNKLGKDIFIRASEVGGLPGTIKMPAGNNKAIKVPVPKTMLDSHLKGNFHEKLRVMVTVIVVEAELQKVEALSTQQYSVSVRLYKDQNQPSDSCLNQQSARTCGTGSDSFEHSDVELVTWNEVFFFKHDYVDCCMVEFIVTETGKGERIGYYSSSLEQLTGSQEISDSYNHHELRWLDLSSAEADLDARRSRFGRIKCAVILPAKTDTSNFEKSLDGSRQSNSVQISPTREGPWTTVRLSYGAPAACWRLGNDVIASEVSVIDGNRYVNIRSLVSVRNNTEFSLDLCLKLKASDENANPISGNGKGAQYDRNEFATDEFFEYEKYNPVSGWIPRTEFDVEVPGVDLPSGWEWVDDWHVDNSSVKTAAGWVYAPDFESLKWPESYNSLKYVNYARQRRWIRKRRQADKVSKSHIIIGPLRPGETISLPLHCLYQSNLYVLHLRPSDSETASGYSWSDVMDISAQSQDLQGSKEISEILVSALTESEKLLCCSKISASSSNSFHSMWFCLCSQATEIAKDIHFKPIKDWTIVVKPPVSVSNYLPLKSEISLLEMQSSGHFLSCYRGIFGPGETVKVYNADIRNPLYMSLLPQRGWLPLHEAVLVSHPSDSPSKTVNLRSSVSGRIVQIILELNHTNDRPLEPKIIKVYSPYWLGIARCPPLSFRFIDTGIRKRKNPLSLQSKKVKEVLLEEITDEDMHEGYTIAAAMNFKSLGISASISQSGGEQFGPVRDLSPLGDMDGSLDLYAYNTDGKCMKLFVSSKPCPYQSVPTKVVSVRPFMTFTNRVGQKILLKFSSEDEPKALRVSDTRVSFIYLKTDEPEKIQVRLDDTDWSYPIQVAKEDTLTLALKKHDGTRKFIRTEIRGYEEGSRFIVVFRVGSINGPIRVENRTRNSTARFRQTGFGDDAWTMLQPLSTVNFSWEDPYGQKVIDTEVHSGSKTAVHIFDVDNPGFFSFEDNSDLYVHVATIGDIKVIRFIDDSIRLSISKEGGASIGMGSYWGNSHVQAKKPESGSPLEIIIELGVVGISVVDHKPQELAYLYMERFFISYSTGYDSGATSRFKLIVGYMQLDNQLPLSIMPVLLAPEQTPDMNHPVFKMTITVRNENLDGLQIYPYIYIRVTDKSWRLNIHEPVIWAMVDFFNNLQLDRIPTNSSVTQVDPEIRVDLIDISEVRLKVSLETAPAQRPHGLLGVWSPVLSAVGNAFKIQIHLRKVMHTDRFLRKSSVISAIGNRIWRDLIHNPLHLIFSVDVLGMTSSTLASLSKGFAKLSTDGQFLQLRSKQVWSRKITGVGDGIAQGTEALAQGFAFGVSGIVRKPVESARQNGLLGLAHGLGQAFVGMFVQPVSGALDFFSLTVDGIGASCSRCLEILNNKKNFQRIRNPRAFHSDYILREYTEKEALGQMILYLAEASRNFGCTEIFKEPSKFAWSDCYEEHFIVAYQRVVLVTNRRVMLLQSGAPDRMDKRPCKIMWDVPWEEVLTLELAKAGYSRPSHLIIHLKNFRKAENFVRVIKCKIEQLEEESEPQAIRICSVVRKMWKAHHDDMKSIILQDPSRQRHASSSGSEIERRESQKQQYRSIVTSTRLSSSSSNSQEGKSVKHSINFSKVWSSEQESKARCTLCRKQNSENGEICSIWRPICPDGYVSIGDIARCGKHPPNVAAVYRNADNLFTVPIGFDLVWRNCLDDYKSPVSIWLPRAPEGYVSLGCVAVASFTEPELDSVYCVAESLGEETTFEEQKIWSAPDSYPWACHIYQSRSDALHFVALRQPKEESELKPKRVLDNPPLIEHSNLVPEN